MFGGDAQRVSQIVTFADEIKADTLSEWAYLTILSVPARRAKEAHERLLQDRADVGYEHELKWRKLKRTEKDHKPSHPERLARRWLERVVNEHDMWSFTVLGIDTRTLCLSAFGERPVEQRTNYYRRFYRSALHYHTSCLSRKADRLEVLRCYHDTEGNLEEDVWFDWHPQARIAAANDKVEFKAERLTFVDSDHAKEEKHAHASQFVQLCDVLGASVRYLHEAHGINESRDNVSRAMLELVRRLNCSKESRNKNSSYKHVGRASLSYFPKRALTVDELEEPFLRAQSTFYKDRELRLLTKQSKQGGFEF